MKTDRSLLRESLNESIVPRLLADGFDGKAISGNSRSYEFKRTASNETQKIIIIFDKNGKGSCGVQLEIELGKNKSTKNDKRKFIVGLVQRKGIIGRKRIFKSSLGFIEKLKGISREELVQSEVSELQNILKEVEAWWETRKESDHIYTYEEEY